MQLNKCINFFLLRSSAKTKDYYNEAKSWLNKDAINKKSIWLIPVCEG